MSFRVTEELISPEKAKGFLANMKNDRPLSKNAVLNYTEVMRRGQWKFNGDPIRINSEGRLIDGQHRLHAIVNSAKPQKMVVMYGLDNGVFDTIDVGKRRSPADLLSIAGFTHTTAVAAVARALLIYEAGAHWSEEVTKNIDTNPTGNQIVEYSKANPEVFEAVKMIYNSFPYVVRIAPPSAVGLAYVLAARQSRTKADAFLAGFAGNEPTQRDDPRWVAREYMSRHKADRTHRLTSHQAQAVMLKAMNLFFAGLPASTATIRFQPEKHWFPRFDGGRKDARLAAKRQQTGQEVRKAK